MPSAKTTSALDIISIAALDPLYPKGPTARGCLPGKLSLCWYPQATGALNFSASFLQSSIASAKITPAPDKMTGNFALDKRSAASLIASVPPAGLSNLIIGGRSISTTWVQKSLGIFN